MQKIFLHVRSVLRLFFILLCFNSFVYAAVAVNYDKEVSVASGEVAKVHYKITGLDPRKTYTPSYGTKNETAIDGTDYIGDPNSPSKFNGRSEYEGVIQVSTKSRARVGKTFKIKLKLWHNNTNIVNKSSTITIVDDGSGNAFSKKCASNGRVVCMVPNNALDSRENARWLKEKIEGDGITISNAIVYNRANRSYDSSEIKQIGYFANGIEGANLKIDSGIFLSTMDADNIFRDNKIPKRSDTTSGNDVATFKDNDLGAIDNKAKYDTIVFEFDVTLDKNTRFLLVDYQFASEEYPFYVGSKYNDAFGFFISGGDLSKTYNIARLIDTRDKITTENIQQYDPVTVNNVNSGHVGEKSNGTPIRTGNADYYIRNYKHSINGGVETAQKEYSALKLLENDAIYSEFNGFTIGLKAILDNLTPGKTYHFKMALADTGDARLDTGVFVKRIRGLKTPELCYDYAYEQNSVYFTEENDGTRPAIIRGDVRPNDDINVTLYLKNIEKSQIDMSNIKMHFLDINTSQAVYKGNSVYVTKKNEITPILVKDEDLQITDKHVKNIPIDTIGNNDFIYAYYTLKPKTSHIKMPINAQLSYDVSFDVGGDEPITGHYDMNISDGSIPVCTNDNLKYKPVWGQFNVGAKGIYKSYSSSNEHPKFNIPTQVVQRASSFLVTSHNKELVEGVPYIKEQKYDTVVAVDVIDASKFHYTKASCDELSASVAERIWVPMFQDGNSVSKKSLNEALKDAKKVGLIDFDQKDYFLQAKRNSAFRVSANVIDNNNSAMKIETKKFEGKYIYKIRGYDDYLNWLKYNAKKPDGNLYGSIESIPCKSPSSSFVVDVCSKSRDPQGYFTLANLSRCNECLMGYRTVNMCSRDNFAIRPESFHVQLNDISQIDPLNPSTPPQSFATDRTGKVNVVNKKVDMAGGYKYQVEINATSHKDGDLSSALGYTRLYKVKIDANGAGYNNENNMTFYWNGPPKPKCNDTASHIANANNQSIYFVHGQAVGEIALNNIGDYIFSMIDKTWTAVDWKERYLAHHKKSSVSIDGIEKDKDVTHFFVDQGRALDCKKESHEVVKNSVLPKLSFQNQKEIKNLNGCDISTKEHNNQDTNIKYRDYAIEFHPYKFRHTLANTYWNPFQSYESNESKSWENWLYMASMDHQGDINQSVHFRGDIEAVGYNDHNLTNFVENCYAKDMNATFARVMSRLADANATHPKLQYRVFTYDENNNTILDENQTNDYNTTKTLVEIGKNSFAQGLAGKMQLNTNVNFTRERNITVNPIRVLFQDINTTCKDEKECTMQANFNSSFTTEGNSAYDRAFDFYYGRIWAPNLEDIKNFTLTTFRYEVFCSEPECNSTLYPSFGEINPISSNWHLNLQHVDAYGDVSKTTSKNRDKNEAFYSIIAPNPSTINIVVGEQKDINISASKKDTTFDDIIQIYPSFWLLYNEHNGSVETFDFSINFLGPTSWSGQGALGNVLDDADDIRRTNRRLAW